MNPNEYVFVGGPANGHRLATGGEFVYKFWQHVLKRFPQRESLLWGPLTPPFPETYYMPEECLYHLVNFNGVKFYRYEKDTSEDSLQKLLNNYKPKKKKL
jgi:hypothetical protein